MKEKYSGGLVGALVAGSLFLAGSLIYFVVRKDDVGPVPPPSPTTAVTTSPAPENTTAPLVTKDWETYHNTKYQFALNYPATWPVRDRSIEEDCDEKTVCEIIFGRLPTGPSDKAALTSYIEVLVSPPAVVASNDEDGGFENCRQIGQLVNVARQPMVKKECEGIDGTVMHIYSLTASGTRYDIVQVVSAYGAVASADEKKIFETLAGSFAADEG